MGEKDICAFCNNEKILRKSPGIGEPLIEYYCPECSSPDETKYPKVTCPVCNGTGNIRKLTSIYNQGSITYRNNRRNKICYMCNGKGEINIISLGDKNPFFNQIKGISKRKEKIPQKTYKNQKERDKRYGYRLPLKYELFDITKKLIKGIVLLGIILVVFSQLPIIIPTLNNFSSHNNQINRAINTINNIHNDLNIDSGNITQFNSVSLQEVAISPKKYEGKEINLQGKLKSGGWEITAIIQNENGYYIHLKLPGGNDGQYWLMKNRKLQFGRTYTFSGKMEYFAMPPYGGDKNWQFVVNKINGNIIQIIKNNSS